METSNTKNLATFTHLSILTQYFIPFGNFIFPLVIWSSAKKDSEFVDSHGKQAINFQLSIFLYSIVLCLIAIPILIYTIFKNISLEELINNSEIGEQITSQNISGIVAIAIIAGLVFFLIKVIEFFLIIFASVRAANGEKFFYPMTINFLR